MAEKTASAAIQLPDVERCVAILVGKANYFLHLEMHADVAEPVRECEQRQKDDKRLAREAADAARVVVGHERLLERERPERWKKRQRRVMALGRDALHECIQPGLARYVEAVMRRFHRERIDERGIRTDVHDEAYKRVIKESCAHANFEMVLKNEANQDEWPMFLALEPWRRTLALFQVTS